MAHPDSESIERLDRLIEEVELDAASLEIEGTSSGNRDFQAIHGKLDALKRVRETLLAPNDPTRKITRAVIISRSIYMRVFGLLKTPSMPARDMLVFDEEEEIQEGRIERKIDRMDTGGDLVAIGLASLFRAITKDGEDIKIIQRLEGTRTEIRRAYIAYLIEKKESEQQR